MDMEFFIKTNTALSRQNRGMDNSMEKPSYTSRTMEDMVSMNLANEMGKIWK